MTLRPERLQQRHRQRLLVHVTVGGEEAVDASDRPRFMEPNEPVATVIKASVFDFGLLSVFTILAFGGAFLAFVRYDVR